jgi:hypothetical protein
VEVVVLVRFVSETCRHYHGVLSDGKTVDFKYCRIVNI